MASKRSDREAENAAGKIEAAAHRIVAWHKANGCEDFEMRDLGRPVSLAGVLEVLAALNLLPEPDK